MPGAVGFWAPIEARVVNMQHAFRADVGYWMYARRYRGCAQFHPCVSLLHAKCQRVRWGFARLLLLPPALNEGRAERAFAWGE